MVELTENHFAIFLANDDDNWNEEDEMQAQEATRGMFTGWEYFKSTAEIKAAMEKKIAQLKAKVTEREGRLAMLRAEYKITDAMLVDLFRQAREATKHSLSNVTYSTVSAREGGKMEEVSIGAGVINNLLTEGDYVESEKKDAARLEMIARNLSPRTKDDGRVVDMHRLALDEIKYLGF